VAAGIPAATRIRLARHRRPLAAVLAAAATGFGLLALRPPPPPSVQILAAARDLPGGTTLRTRDLRVVALPVRAVPDGAVRSGAPWRGLTGRVLAGPMRRGEPLTDAGLLGAGLLDGYGPDVVAAPVRVADPGAARLLHAGDRIDVLAVAGGGPLEDIAPAYGRRARTVVSSVPVIAVPREPPGDHGALVVLATSREQAMALAGAGAHLSVTVAAGRGG
jgi:Flp pilus assembly protein CpaB